MTITTHSGTHENLTASGLFALAGISRPSEPEKGHYGETEPLPGPYPAMWVGLWRGIQWVYARDERGFYFSLGKATSEHLRTLPALPIK